MSSIAIVSFCTDAYAVLWEEFYKSCEQNFCQGSEKHYFIFTNSTAIKHAPNITVVYQENYGWPIIALFRWRMMLRAEEQLKQFEKIVLFNINAYFPFVIKKDEFFGENKKILAGLHPAFFNKPKEFYTYEPKEKSTAYVKEKKFYFQFCLAGGNSADFLAVAYEIKKNIEIDLDNGIMATWQDESHWNAYINNNFDRIATELQILQPSYLYPENQNYPISEVKIVMRDKNKYKEIKKLKGIETLEIFRIINKVKKIIHKIIQ